jgi:acyl-CoA thioester hydrolase
VGHSSNGDATRPETPAAAPWAYEYEVPLRWTDMDASGHVNNATFLTLLEEGRDRWLAGIGLRRDGYVIAHVEISFMEEITEEHETVTARFRADSLGNSTIVSDEELVTGEGTVLAAAKVVSVAWDGDTRRSRPLTASEREAATASPDASARRDD